MPLKEESEFFEITARRTEMVPERVNVIEDNGTTLFQFWLPGNVNRTVQVPADEYLELLQHALTSHRTRQAAEALATKAPDGR